MNIRYEKEETVERFSKSGLVGGGGGVLGVMGGQMIDISKEINL